MSKDASYWNNSGKYQKQYDELFKSLVPANGSCQYVEGEIIRACTKIYYDLMNNGFGNNWSGALKYIQKYGKISESDFKELEYYADGTFQYNDLMDDVEHKQVEQIIQNVMNENIEYVMSKNNNYTLNNVDMYSLDESEGRIREKIRSYEDSDDEEFSYTPRKTRM